MCIFMKLCKRTWMGGHDCSGFEKDIPRWVGLVLVRCSPVAAVIECDVGSSFFPIFTFSLLQMLCARSPYSSLKKNHSFKEDGTIYLYICLYEYSTECFISILQKNKVNYTGSWNKHCRDLVKIGCSLKIQGEYIGNPRDKSQVACMMDC